MYRGPCIGTIYPTLLGFGGIQAIILSYSLSYNKFSQKIYKRNVMPRDIMHQCNSILTCIINELREEISGQATMQNIKHNMELFHQNPQQITLQMSEKHTTIAIKYINLQSLRQRLCASNH